MLILYLLSLLYGVGVYMRNYLYDRGLFKVRKLPVPVISVGNISLGGSGKTSLVVFLAEELSKERRVAVLLRGYKRKTRGPLIVSEWGRVLVGPEEAGDEAYMISRIVPGVSVVVAEDRFEGGKIAVEKLRAELIILDDGFQHRRLWRDVDVVLVRKRDLEDLLLPAGRLREPTSSLRRADALVLSYQEIEPFDMEADVPVFKMERVFEGFLDTDFRLHPLGELEGKEVVAFCGLADNEQFFTVLEKLGIKVKERRGFPDHYHYKDVKLREGEIYVTTLKDLVKLPKLPNIFALHFSVRVPGLVSFIRSHL